ncbi:MAG: TldD/PmbA family protein [Alphaproteobacteria bacterium]|nr:TldD/PmbA family protein [Alphaproteobacteria bacterium]
MTAAHDVLGDVLKKAQAAGATAADALLVDSASVSIMRRMGKPESVTRSEECEIGLRVFVGKRQALVSSSDKSPDTLKEMAERAVAMAKAAPEDPYAGIAAEELLARSVPDMDLHDGTELSVDGMNDLADAAESAALGVKGVTNSDGAECTTGSETVWYAASNGFSNGYASSDFSLVVSVIAGSGTAMETDYSYDSTCYLSDLKAPEDIGRDAGERAVKSLNPKKGTTKQVPVVFDRRVAGSLIGSLSSAASGGAVARGTTLLKDKMGKPVCAPHITIIDDPFIKRGPRSRPFDGEGILPQKRAVIDKGVLTGWFLDLSSARQLGLQSTGNAVRGVSSQPVARPANFTLQPGDVPPEDLIADIKEGFFVTRLMGSGGNIVTGDYSRGAAGFWIENGKITHPVSEMTIAGNFADMWMNMIPANDLEILTGIDAPTLMLTGMTVAGA